MTNVTSQVVMVVLEHVAELKFVFPAELDALNDTEFFEEGNSPIDTRSVNLISASFD